MMPHRHELFPERRIALLQLANVSTKKFRWLDTGSDFDYCLSVVGEYENSNPPSCSLAVDIQNSHQRSSDLFGVHLWDQDYLLVSTLFIANRNRYWSTSVKGRPTMEVNNTAFVSPTANAPYNFAQPLPFVDRIVASLNFWSISLTLLLVAITYDQCMCNHTSRKTWY